MSPFHWFLFTIALIICWLGRGEPPPGEILLALPPLVILGAAAAMGAAAGGIEAGGRYYAQKKFEKSKLGKAQAAIAEEAAETAGKSTSELGLNEAQKRGAISRALAGLFAQRRQAAGQEQTSRQPTGPARSGVAAVRAIEEEMEGGKLSAKTGADIERTSAQLAVAEKTAAIGTALGLAAQKQQQMVASGAAVGKAVAGAGLGAGVAATSGTQELPGKTAQPALGG